MNFFNRKTSWTNLEFIPLKLAIASAYLLIGAYFHEFVTSYYVAFMLLFAFTVIWSVYLWISKMKREP